ncbi:MAG: hypothetical protein COV71_05180 [Candidatus Omnitrophica bacterium CG11_big_fil_rev_8_21_14_0_20_41_12]|nr:MAG: hypothetical protein COV71_05180 [Candidatus Omnitrophica bacterium CG11_big_fil_rev_8_21_14_0_20_41_12]
MKDENVYKEIINTILKSKIEILGQLAIKKARSVDGIQLSEGGEITSFSIDPKQVLDNFLLKFEEISGVVSNYTAQVVIEKILDKYPDIELPNRLKN